MKKGFFLLFLISTVPLFAQTELSSIIKKKYNVKNDTIQISPVSISPYGFKVLSDLQTEIDTSNYTIDFSTALLTFKPNLQPKPTEVTIEFTPYPDFLTKTYSVFNKKLIVPNTTFENKLFSLPTNYQKSTYKPFDGLNTSGNITRGLTVGNNQNGVTNATLDLQIEGKLSDKVTLKASIIDTNLPIQENGNTYKLNEFDRVFIELASDTWQINAGDIYLNNTETSFLRFHKKVSGLAVNAQIKNENSEINIETSGAIVKGKYKKIQFNGREGNQGPYSLSDLNDSYILILSNTEQIYVNGIQLKRGEENDYTIDYNTAEVTFSTTFPITANMRITAEYQYTDRVYTRFVTYNNIDYNTEKLSVSGYFYNENDLKNQPLEQDLSDEQKHLLANAGNNKSLMVSPSAYEDSFSEDKIQYKKTTIGTAEVFEYSTNETDQLYNVSFTYVGENLGNYTLKDIVAYGKIYEYVGENLGNYNPVIQLTAPDKLQLFVLKTLYKPTPKTTVNIETALSSNDQNLFSTIDDENNKGLATKIGWEQILLQKKWELKSNLKFDYLNDHFTSIERIQPVEFNRDWNIETIDGTQKLLNTSLQLSKQKNKVIYEFENLKFGDFFTGNKHHFYGNLFINNLSVTFNNSILNSESALENGVFSRNFIAAKYHLKKSWYGVLFNAENNKKRVNERGTYSNLSHKFNEYEAFLGVGDSTKVFSQIGINFRTTDSIQNNRFERVNNAKTYYIKSTFINSKTANLNTYINYRTVENANYKNEESLNSKIVYQQQLFKQFLSLSTTYQTLSGNLPQQDYTYIKTEPGQGFYTWIDYNNNEIKELNEFEIAQFPDQATYLRVILPTVKYIATHQNKFIQSIAINPQQWNLKKGIQKLFSYFYNQTAILIDNKQKKQTHFNLNPFDITNDNLIGLNFNVNNNFYFNRGKKHYSTTYNYINSQTKNTTTIDNLENNLKLHKLEFEHKLGNFWQLNFEVSNAKNTTNSLNYVNRNYKLNNNSIFPKISYYYTDNVFVSIFYEFKNKENKLGDFETLKLQNIGFQTNYANGENYLLKAEINLFKNKFTGNNNSPVGYQMLEGLQPGNNYTWSLLFYKKLNSFLNLNINYLGRKSETSKTIHTGTIQLKALF
ncbi:hypothetical protein [Lutibacter maritimus]|uniref:Outer membrane protein beta-barrel family protein n=1 Tax=Lutibacter maritimus TaxID=593133 RepID=A0A1I6RLC0_9FLAO|nr:hypothetical protein [Lutibacter maritimus]SFS65531.1 hypothetical protein SAMN04488006_2603 [Lutibacter maritimus]